MDFTLRPARDDEMSFVYAGWIRSCAPCAPARVWHDGKGTIRTKRMNRRAWEALLSARIARLRETAQTLVAELAGSLLGFVCFDLDARSLHFVYVEWKFQRKGLARRMLNRVGTPEEGWRYTHWTPLVEELPVPSDWRWDEGGLESR